MVTAIPRPGGIKLGTHRADRLTLSKTIAPPEPSFPFESN